MSNLFRINARPGSVVPATPLDALVGDLQAAANRHGSKHFASSVVARGALGLESLSQTQESELESAGQGLHTALEQIASSHKQHYTAAQLNAASIVGVVAADIPAFLRNPIVKNVVASESIAFVSPQGGDMMSERMRPALEAYDERENKNATVYSVAYNLQASRQDEFGEAFYPTVTVAPSEVGFTVSIRLIQVYDEVRRSIAGKVDNFGKRNIVQAVIDPTILRNDQSKIVPVYRDESKAQMVSNTLLAPKTINLEGEAITTSALKIGTNLSLLGISQTDALLATGLQDSTDAIDSAVGLETLYLRVPGATSADDRVIRFNTLRLPLATFSYSVQGNTRLMSVNFATDALQVNLNTKATDGAAVTKFAPITTNTLSVRLGVRVSGSVNLETAETNLFASEVTVEKVTDADGNSLALGTGLGATAAALFAGVAVVGYDLDARRSNVNRRQRGQLLDTTFYNQVYAVPLRSPITVPRPLTVGDANDSSDLAALITATRIRTSNGAVDELLRVQDVLAEYVNAGDQINASPEILGVTRFLVKPFFERFALNVSTIIDSVKSHERAADIQAVLVNQIRDMAYRAYTASGYKAAADALAGGMSTVPTVIIGTDPILARYLTVTGDLRTLGGEFNVKIVSTLNRRMSGKIAITFGDFGNEGSPNPLHFGNMAWKPELTLVLPIHRNGANSKELTVQPSFLHVTNLPILAMLDVTGVPDVVTHKVPVNMHTV